MAVPDLSHFVRADAIGWLKGEEPFTDPKRVWKDPKQILVEHLEYEQQGRMPWDPPFSWREEYNAPHRVAYVIQFKHAPENVHDFLRIMDVNQLGVWFSDHDYADDKDWYRQFFVPWNNIVQFAAHLQT